MQREESYETYSKREENIIYVGLPELSEHHIAHGDGSSAYDR
jgi:hypothetical protein